VKDESVAPSALIPSGVFIAGCMLGIAIFDPRIHSRVFVACTAVAGVAYLFSLPLLGRVDRKHSRALALFLVMAALWRIPLLLAPPTLSSDVYRYVWDGRLQHLGYDPYVVVPGDGKYQQLHTAETRLINHPDVPTPYPAAAEFFFRIVVMVSDSARAMKTAILLCDAALVAVLLSWLITAHRNPWWVLAYAWNPLVSIEGAGNGHIDVLGALCLVVAVASLARRRRAMASIALAFAVGIKFLPVILVPLFWRRVRIRDAALGAVILAGLYLPFLGRGRLPFGSLGKYLALWRYNAPIYAALERVLPNTALLGVSVGIGFALALWARFDLELDSPAAWAWPLATTLLFAPTIFPWYLLWLTPFVSTAATFPLAVWTVSSILIYWPLPMWAEMLVEYGAFLVASGWILAQLPLIPNSVPAPKRRV
jgi:alpha-1,6-mannosyltransferase